MRFNLDHTYLTWLEELKVKIHSAQSKAAIAVNQELIFLYWELGKRINEKENTWGSKLIEQVSNDLRDAFPDMKGFSRSNLYYCKKFFLFYRNTIVQQPVGQLQDAEILNNTTIQQLVGQIPWGHHILIFSNTETVENALFYIQKTAESQWSRETLKDNLKNKLHLRIGKASSNFDTALPKPLSNLVQQAIKDPYVFDFLQLDTAYRERNIEQQLVKHVNRFLLELGKGFAFVGQQYPIQVSDKEYFLDLLFYHIHLKCYVVIELKNTAFQPEYTGKLNFYLSAVDSLLKTENENPSIGLLLCKEKDSIEVEFALRDIQKPIGISEYILTKKLPDNLKSSLPTIEEIENQLNIMDENSTDEAK